MMIRVPQLGCLLLLTFLFIDGQNTGTSIDYNKKGLYLPRDVIFDDDIATALAKLRKGESNNNNNDTLTLSCLEETGRYLTLSLTGYKGGKIGQQICQDRSFVQELSDNNNFLMGVFDGHGDTGHHCAQFSRVQVNARIKSALETLEAENSSAMIIIISQLLRTTFEEVDQQMPKPYAGDGGTTATVVLKYQDSLYFANTGDSQSILGAYVKGKVVFLFETRRDQPNDPSERQRVLDAGGAVSGESLEDVARVEYKLNGVDYGLAMTRSLGDWQATGVIATPLVTVFHSNELIDSVVQRYKVTCGIENCPVSKDDVNLFVVSVSDGIIDYVQPVEILEEMGPALFANEVHPLLAAEKIIHEAAQRWYNDFHGHYRDDIAIAVAKLIL